MFGCRNHLLSRICPNLPFNVDPCLVFSLESLTATVIFTLITWLVFLLIKQRAKPPDAIQPKRNWGSRLFVFIAMLLLVIAVSRLLQMAALSCGIPNEGRSLIISGYEIHHTNYGLLLIYVSGHLFYFCSAAKLKNAALVLLALGIALVYDQISYYAMSSITDAAYLSPASYAGAITIAAIPIIILFWQTCQPTRTARR